jgi:hypothetical protein
MNFISSAISSSGDWRKRRRFMDAARPFVESLVTLPENERVYEDSLFEELKMKPAQVAELQSFLERTFAVKYDAREFATKCDSLATAFELTLTLPGFLKELDASAAVAAALPVALGVPLWVAERNLFVLQEGRDRVELRYQMRKAPVVGRDTIAFTEVHVEGTASAAMTESLVSFALSEIVRRDLRAAVGTVPVLNAYVRENPGWMPFISSY